MSDEFVRNCECGTCDPAEYSLHVQYDPKDDSFIFNSVETTLKRKSAKALAFFLLLHINEKEE